MESPLLIEKIKFWTPTWGAWMPIQAFGLYAIFFADVPAAWWIYVTIGYLLFAIVGIAVCYHRYLGHRSFTVATWVQKFMLWCGIMAGQGRPIFWVLIHRGYHHRLADTKDDPHSPRHGFWHAYAGWLFKIKPAMNTKYALDLLQNSDVVFAHRFYFPILWISNALIFFISYDLWLWGVMVPAFITFHAFALNTSANHYPNLGYRNYSTTDDSANVIWLWPILLGDAWHNNHHGSAKNSNFSRRWWEIDPASWIIQLIRTDRSVA